MSDADDRMERADRIREMRQSRDHDATAKDQAAGADGTQSADTDDDQATATKENQVTGADEDQGRDGPETATATVEQRSPTVATEGNAASAPTTGGGIAPLGSAAGVSLSDAMDDGDASDDGGPIDGDERAAGSRAHATTAAVSDASVRVLEFTVGEQTYCIDIERVEEIVKRETVTRVPNTPSYVEGVVDLRGQITTILDTKRLLDVETGGREDLLVIFGPNAFEEHGSVGWVVDEVQQVVPVTDELVRRPPSDDEYVRGIVDREDTDDLVVWIRPGVAMSRAVAGEVDDGTDEE